MNLENDEFGELFDWARSRSCDPATSTQAASEIEPRLTARAKQFLQGLNLIGGTGTAREVASSVADGIALHDSIRRRATDLVRLGLIQEIEARVCRVSGKKATVYRLTDSQG